MNICLFGASSEEINKVYFEEVEKLGPTAVIEWSLAVARPVLWVLP